MSDDPFIHADQNEAWSRSLDAARAAAPPVEAKRAGWRNMTPEQWDAASAAYRAGAPQGDKSGETPAPAYPSPDPVAGLREALTTALTVALHEHFDPECSGLPDYEVTAEQAEKITEWVVRQPIMVAALLASDKPPKPERLATAMRAFYGKHGTVFDSAAAAIAAEYARLSGEAPKDDRLERIAQIIHHLKEPEFWTVGDLDEAINQIYEIVNPE